MNARALDDLDRRIINTQQDGFPLCDHPFAAVAAHLGIDEALLIERIGRLVKDGLLSRFGPLFNAERLGGAVTLCALEVPGDDFARVTALVNAHPEVAHNYRRDHAFNMWFVIATERPEQIVPVIAAIEAETGLSVYNFPKQQEFFLELKVAV
ncbi:MAG: Lrp/AsnC family transcriptional regulator [Alphaproteobacteria bacterium]